MSFFVVGGEGLEPPEAERPSRLQRDVIAAIRTAQITYIILTHFAFFFKYLTLTIWLKFDTVLQVYYPPPRDKGRRMTK